MKDAAVRIRHVEPRDATEWIAMRAALWPDQDRPSLVADVDRFFADPRDEPGAMPEAVLVAEAPGTSPGLVGFVELSRRAYAEGCDTSPVAFLEGWYVAPNRRRHGIGRALVAAAETWARELGCREFASDALADNTVSRASHRALGFEETVQLRCFKKRL